MLKIKIIKLYDENSLSLIIWERYDGLIEAAIYVSNVLNRQEITSHSTSCISSRKFDEIVDYFALLLFMSHIYSKGDKWEDYRGQVKKSISVC